MKLLQLLYSGKFSYGANFRIFHMHVLHAKIKLNHENLNHWNFCVNFDLTTRCDYRIRAASVLPNL